MNRLKWFVIGFLSVFLIALSLVWFKRETVESDLLKALIKKVPASLPFVIEHYEIAKNLNSLSLTLNFQGKEVKLDGPLQWKWIKKNGIQLVYKPEVLIDGASPFLLLLTAQTEREWTRLDQLDFEIPATDFKWRELGIDAKKISLAGSFENHLFKSDLSFESVAWVDPKNSTHAIDLTRFKTNLSLPDPDQLTELESEMSAKEVEILWGKDYLDLPLIQFPLKISLKDGNLVHVNVGKNRLDVAATLDGDLAHFNQANAYFKLSPFSVSDFITWSSKNLVSFFPALQSLGDGEVKKGSLGAQGSFEFQKSPSKMILKTLKAEAKDIGFRSSTKKIAVSGLDLNFNYDRSKKHHSAQLNAKKILFDHFEGALGQTNIAWNENTFETSDALPLSIKNIPLSFGKVTGQLKPEFNLVSSLNLKPVSITPIANGLCLNANKIPPITVSGNFLELNISKSAIEPTGRLEADVFGGKVVLNNFEISDLDSEVPETDFDLDWTGIDLAKLNAWSNFGEVKGTFEGYAHDVVLQAMLPTQYHFLLNVEPYDRKSKTARVEYSPEAMKNVVKIFTGADLDQQIPGIAGWLMFGWPSHVLGGYDVYYAGLKLTSEDGHIVIETLDRPGIVETERKHFVLYGPRFKMPLNNSTYPLIIDATAMSNFVHQLLTQLQAIKEKKEITNHEEDKDTPCETPEI